MIVVPAAAPQTIFGSRVVPEDNNSTSGSGSVSASSPTSPSEDERSTSTEGTPKPPAPPIAASSAAGAGRSSKHAPDSRHGRSSSPALSAVSSINIRAQGG